MRLYARADRPRSLALVSTLLRESDRHARLQLSYTDGRARAEREHAELLALCEVGQVREACRLLRAHIEKAGEALLTFMKAQKQA
jgi:DNA-binding GntR family transcriptional regulator